MHAVAEAGTFAGSKSMRDNYKDGPDKYYEQHGTTYRNPHFPAITTCVRSIMDVFWEKYSCEDAPLDVLDLACGSGEGTIALRTWWLEGRDNHDSAANNSAPAPPPTSPPNHSAITPQPSCPSSPLPTHTATTPIRPRPLTKSLLPPSLILNFTAFDPYTTQAFNSRTGLTAEGISFQDIADGCLVDDGRSFDLCICSFAAHLLDGSKLYATMSSLSLSARFLLILSPHKKPVLQEHMGWVKVEEVTRERVHARLYRSTNMSDLGT